MNSVDTFRQAIAQAGLTPPETILADGKLHRFSSNGDRADDAGWYVLHIDGIPAGSFGDWRSGLKQNWCAKPDREMSAKERHEHGIRVECALRQRETDERLRHAEAAQRAQQFWNGAKPAPANHPYLMRKSIHPHGLRVDAEGRLIVPVMIDGTLSSLQYIDTEGGKLFLPGGAVQGGSYTIGDLTEVATVLICEGFATGESLHEATGLPVMVAFFAGNLTSVAKQLRQQFSAATIIVCGDNDLSGTGQRAACEAAEAVNGVVALTEEEGQDFNDVHVQHGLDAIKEAITTAIQQVRFRPMKSGHILDAIYAFLGRFVAYPSVAAQVAHTLWVVHTHLMDLWESTPRLAFLSPEPSSGKTRALEITETLVPRPVEAVNVTPAYLFRKISDPVGLPTILHDEIDTIFGPRAKEHEEIRGVINAGHRRGASAGRCVVKGKQIETEELPAFCAVALAGLGNLPDTILTRCVIIRMRRRAAGETVEPYRRRLHAPEGYLLRERLVAWVKDIRSKLNTDPSMPEGITDRNADVWESLLSVADAAGGAWPKRARVSAVSLVSDAKEGQPSLGMQLLGDLRIVFGDHDSLWTVDIVRALINREESAWGDLKGKPLDARRLASLLKPYAVVSKQVRIGDRSQKGYTRAALEDAWVRYLPPVESVVGVSPMMSETSETNETAPTGLFVEVEEVVNDDH